MSVCKLYIYPHTNCAGGACQHHLRQPAWHDEAVHGRPCTVEEQQSGHGEWSTRRGQVRVSEREKHLFFI